MSRRLRIKSKIWIEADGRLIFSDGRLALLEAVERLGSLSKAARHLEMSYRAAWGMLRLSEQKLGVKLLAVQIGGPGGGGARLTPAARKLIRRFRRVKARVNREADAEFARRFR